MHFLAVQRDVPVAAGLARGVQHKAPWAGMVASHPIDELDQDVREAVGVVLAALLQDAQHAHGRAHYEQPLAARADVQAL